MKEFLGLQPLMNMYDVTYSTEHQKQYIMLNSMKLINFLSVHHTKQTCTVWITFMMSLFGIFKCIFTKRRSYKLGAT